jgi:K+-transporting ATPase KdpF subunit
MLLGAATGRTKDMSLENLIGLALSGLLLVYLTYALLRAEKF